MTTNNIPKPLANKAAIAIIAGPDRLRTGQDVSKVISETTNVDGLFAALKDLLPILGANLSEMREKHGDADGNVMLLRTYYDNADAALKKAIKGAA